MITSSRKQSDKEVETSCDNLMQMYRFVIEVLRKSKYHYLAPPWHTCRRLQSPSICSFFPLQEYNCSVVGQGKCDIDKGPFGQSLSKITAVTENFDQSIPDPHFDSQIVHVFYAY